MRVGTIIDARWIEIIDGAFLDGGRLSGLSSGSTRGIAPPAFALASPGRVRAMRGRRREGLGITTVRNGAASRCTDHDLSAYSIGVDAWHVCS